MDEHVWRPSWIGVDWAVTIMVDLTRDQDGCLQARLLDAVVGRSGTAYMTWIDNQPDGFVAGVETAALDPFRSYSNAIRHGLPDGVAVPEAFHVVRLGTQVVDEVADASSRQRSVTAVTRTTRSTRSAASCAMARAPHRQAAEPTQPLPGRG